MTQYCQDARGRLFRWDAGLQSWFRIVSHDDEYDEASRAVRTDVNWPVSGSPLTGTATTDALPASGTTDERHPSPASSSTCGDTDTAMAVTIRSPLGPAKQTNTR